MLMLMFAAEEPLIQISQLGRQACLVKSTFWDALYLSPLFKQEGVARAHARLLPFSRELV